jgi:DNA ligase (NAD+)
LRYPPAMSTSIFPKPRRRRFLQIWLAVLVLGAHRLPADLLGLPPEMLARAEDLQAEIGRLDEAYFRRAVPEASDEAYDGLKRELAALERAYPELAGAVPVGGDDRSGLFRTARHRVPMTGLDKVYAESELRAFVAGARAGPEGFVIEPKVDGVALSLTYERGRLARVLTRGDGVEGDDVTDLVRGLSGLPAELAPRVPVPELVELRGELHVPLAAFVRVNRERAAAGEPPLANPRSAAAGSLRQTDPRQLAQRGLALVIHGFGAWEPAGLAPATQREFQDRVRAWGLPALEGVRRATGAEAVWQAVEALGRERGRAGLPTDGVVVKVDAVARQRELGESTAGPRWAVAFKFTAPRAATRLLGIEVQVGRTGLLTPVGRLEPVVLAGTVLTRATLHNAEEIARLDLRIGDTVVIEKAGEVIPLVAEVLAERRPAGATPFVFPARCPACGASLWRGGTTLPERRLPGAIGGAARAPRGPRGAGPARAGTGAGRVTDRTWTSADDRRSLPAEPSGPRAAGQAGRRGGGDAARCDRERPGGRPEAVDSRVVDPRGG